MPKRTNCFDNLNIDKKKTWLAMDAVRTAKPAPKLPKDVQGRVSARLATDGRAVVTMTGNRFTVYSVKDYVELMMHGKRLGSGELNKPEGPPPQA
jgi:hypothetical protein